MRKESYKEKSNVQGKGSTELERNTDDHNGPVRPQTTKEEGTERRDSKNEGNGWKGVTLRRAEKEWSLGSKDSPSP